MKQGIFQEKAVESLSTPEQLDQRIKIIPSGGWIMFAAIVIGVAAALLWAFFGTVSSGANYQGVVFDYNDVLSVRAQQDGLLRDVLVEEGDQVARGDIAKYSRRGGAENSAFRTGSGKGRCRCGDRSAG